MPNSETGVNEKGKAKAKAKTEERPEAETTVSEKVETPGGPEAGIVRLKDLVREGRKFSFDSSDEVYQIKHPLQLSLYETARSELLARRFNELMPRFRDGSLAEDEEGLKCLDQVVTEFAELVSTVPKEVLEKAPWWQRLFVVGFFQSEAQVAQKKVVPNRAARRSSKQTSRKS